MRTSAVFNPNHLIRQGFPTWGTFAYLKKNINVFFICKRLYIYQCILFSKITIFYLYGCKNLEVLLKIQWVFVIFLSRFVTRNFRGVCSSL